MKRIWDTVGVARPLLTDPPGADVYVRDYMKPESEWIHLGRSPIQPARLPLMFLSWRVTKEGYADALRANQAFSMQVVKLTPKESTPPGMVLVLGTGRAGQPTPLDDFWLDRYEVTNAEFKKFVDAGGYRERKYWKQPFREGGRALSWEAAMSRFLDATGRPGPAKWELSAFPEGSAQLPVTGVSWFEAAAYAEFAGKELPTVHHWRQAALYRPLSSEIILLSNFGGKGAAAVGKFQGASFFGAFDMAGNVKEWCWNESGANRYIMGGAWSEPSYMFAESDGREPFDRAETFGFRCARYSRPVPETVKAPMVTQLRDYTNEKPATEEQFRLYKSLYSYDRGPLDAKVEAAENDDPTWRMEKITFNAAYANERVIAYLYLPKNAKPPYQTVVHFPAGFAPMMDKMDSLSLHWIRFIVQSGRALLYPVYKGTYERRVKPPISGPLAARDLKIQWCKDLGRSIDYLETRPDMNRSKLGYYGISMGASSALPCLGVEDRFQAVILQAGGLPGNKLPPESDAINFVSRIRAPVLMINGSNDFEIPVSRLQIPLFRLLGSPPGRKRHFMVEGGHVVPRNLVVKETLDWLDRYLGPVR
ncbi:MAG: SUMF1/EgtB/PvdO family nonheme iron enzyme [Acidobacteriia bacterium]|nr:SUMF1/EgtB/PvdO family nonheme iron enzyme [Terriglobia bacterium]